MTAMPTRLLVTATLAQARLELQLMLRSGESLVLTLGVPLGALVFLAAVDLLPAVDDPVGFLVAGVLAISVMATGLVALSIQTAFERKYGVLKRLGGTPLPRAAFVTAKALAVAALVTVQTGLVLAVAAGLLAWRPAGAIPAAAVAMLAGAFTFSALGLLLAGTLRAEGTLAVANAAFLALLVGGGILFDRDALPASLAVIAPLLPSGALGEVLHAALTAPGQVATGALTVLLAWGTAAAVTAARTFRWEP